MTAARNALKKSRPTLQRSYEFSDMAPALGARALEAPAMGQEQLSDKLGGLTGRGDLVGCPECWEPWFAGVQWISEAEWRLPISSRDGSGMTPPHGERISGSLWWAWTAPSSGPVVFRVEEGYSSEQQLELFEGTAWNALRAVTGDHPDRGNGIAADVRAGVTYALRWSTSYNSSPNHLTVSVLQDFVALDAIGKDAQGRLSVRYQASLDRTWRISSSTDLSSWLPWVDLPSNGGRLEFLDASLSLPRRFYRLEPWP